MGHGRRCFSPSGNVSSFANRAIVVITLRMVLLQIYGQIFKAGESIDTIKPIN